MAATDLVTSERLEQVLLGIATQITTGVGEAKTEMTGLITEAELHWLAKLTEQAEPFAGLGPAAAAPDFTAVNDKLRAQHAELQQLHGPGGASETRRDDHDEPTDGPTDDGDDHAHGPPRRPH